jgi:hypothetical protein
MVPHQSSKARLSDHKRVGEPSPYFGAGGSKMSMIVSKLPPIVDAGQRSFSTWRPFGVESFSLKKQGAQPPKRLSGARRVGMFVAQYVPHVTLLELEPLKWLGINAESSTKEGCEESVKLRP